MHPVLIAGYVALFVAVGAAFLAVNLIVGWLVRPRAPNTEKLEVYECGEPAIGSSFVQFDLRFYVVALLFIIFDVEVALFFPWATVFGKATQLADPALVTVQADGNLAPAATGLMREMGLTRPAVPAAEGPLFTPTISEARLIEATRGGKPPAQALGEWSVARAGGLLARTAVVDMAAFFGSGSNQSTAVMHSRASNRTGHFAFSQPQTSAIRSGAISTQGSSASRFLPTMAPGSASSSCSRKPGPRMTCTVAGLAGVEQAGACWGMPAGTTDDYDVAPTRGWEPRSIDTARTQSRSPRYHT